MLLPHNSKMLQRLVMISRYMLLRETICIFNQLILFQVKIDVYERMLAFLKT